MRDVIESRPPILRMTQIWALIREGKYPNKHTLSADLEVSTKTIERDLEYLRDQLQLPMRFNKEKWGWETDPEAILPWWFPEGQKKI